MDEDPAAGLLEVAAVSRALAGETETGDRHVVAGSGDAVLVAAIDGLGHGPSAAHASEIAAEIFRKFADESLEVLVNRCHEALKASRGVAMSLAVINGPSSTLTWAGIGNVEARLVRAAGDVRPASESALLRAGIVGYRLPPVRPSTLPIHRGDLLIMATDGISPVFADGVILGHSPQEIAGEIMTSHRKHDDALVVVARYLGGGRASSPANR